MLLRELLEGFNFKPSDFIEKKGDKEDINFDLAEDIAFFMENDDLMFRQFVAPFSEKKSKYTAFSDGVDSAYTEYQKKYPIRKLPSTLPPEINKMVCKLLHKHLFDTTPGAIS